MHLLDLPVEILDAIVDHLSPRSLNSHRARLRRITPTCRSLASLSRAKLFQKLSLVISEEAGLLEILDGIAENVRYLKIKAPSGDGNAGGIDPIASLIPAVPSHITQVEIVNLVTQSLKKMKNVKDLGIETRVGTITEGEMIDVAQKELDNMTVVLQELRITTFSIAIVDRNQRLTILGAAKKTTPTAEINSANSTPPTSSFLSPFILAANSWTTLRRLDLWRVSFQLENKVESSFPLLEDLILVESKFHSEKELEWCLGGTKNLISLEIRSLNFTISPTSSDPLLSFFSTFSNTLEELNLELVHPITAVDQYFLPSFDQSSCALKKVKLGGPGVTEELFDFLLQSSTITSLELCATTSIEIDFLIKTFADSNSFRNLQNFTLWTFGTFIAVLGLEKVTEDVSTQWTWSEKELNKLVRALRSRNSLLFKMNRVEVDLEVGESDESEETEISETENEDSIFVPTSEGEVYINFFRGGSEEEESDY